MIKNLIYGTLAAGGVAAATALVLTTSSSEPPTTCKVTLDANGGTFLPGTNTVKEIEVAYSNAIGQAFGKYAITNINHDLVGWTDASGVVISNDDPVLSDMECFAKWERSAIQQFDVENGVFDGEVVQFPAVFLGTAWTYDTTNQVIRFKVPETATNDGYRVSFDPQVGYTRLGIKDEMIITQGDVVTNLVFSAPTKSEHVVRFIPGAECIITFWPECPVSVNYSRYALGIGLKGVQVSFDSNDSGKGYGTKGFSEANYTIGYPYGTIPSMTVPSGSKITFKGWYPTQRDGTQLSANDIVGTNEIFYAQWKFPSVPYTVRFNKTYESAEGLMDDQSFMTEVEQALSYNRFYWSGHSFVGWATTATGKKKYDDGEKVVNLTERPDAVVELFAVWRETPGTNSYTVSQYVNEFKNVGISSNVVTVIKGDGNYSTFQLGITNMTPVALRVSLDPKTSTERSGAKLWIEQYDGIWSNKVYVVSDLSTNAVYYTFTNATYRFSITDKDDKAVGTSCGYIVGIGAKGYQINYDPCGTDYVNTSTLSKALSFNWTVDTPYGYWPVLTSSKYGKHLGWFYHKDITDTNEVSETESVVSNATIYAHWANQPYSVKFDGSGAASPNPYVQDFYYDKAQALSRNQFYKDQSRFLGWAWNAGKSGETNVVYRDCQVVSNLCAIAGGTNTLYAVWDSTPGTNWYYVAGGMTNFNMITVSQGSPTYFFGKGDTTQFMVTTTNVAKCRVAIDPQEGFSRTGAKLTIDCAEISTNKTAKLVWENACEVTDLSAKEVTCSFTTNHYYRFTITGSGLVSTTNGYVVSIGAEGSQYVFDACGGNLVGEKETTKMKFYNWTVGSSVAYTPPVTTNAYVHGTNSWHYTPQLLTEEPKLFSVTNAVVSGGEKLYAHWSDAVIVELVFNWNLATCGIATNIVFTNYYGQGSDVYLYKDAYVRQPTHDDFGFLGWTTNSITTAGWNLDEELQPVTTNSPSYFYAQWTKEWRTSRTVDEGLSIDGYYGTLGSSLDIPKQVKTVGGVAWPVSVTAIGDSAFTNCLFTTLSLPSTLTSIGSSAFCGCSAFSTLDIPEAVTYVGDSAFEDCTSLTTVTFPTVYPESEYAESGFLDGVIDPSSPSIELGTCLFKGCTSLSSVELPLGVNCIPDECFSGCTSLTSFDAMPYTVITIGEEAFAGCTHLTNVVHTEIVDEIGSGAFERCARLKFVSFIGDQPESVSSDIFSKTPRNVLVRYLSNMCTTAKDYCGGSWPALPSLWPETTATNSSKTLTWLGGKYPRRKVVFNYNDNTTLWQSTQVPVLYHSGRVFGLLAPTEDEMNGGSSVTASDDDLDDEEEGEEEEEEEEKTGFSGWWTQPIGGRRVGNYWEVPTASDGDSAPITVYAHWGEEKEAGETEIGSRSSEEYPVLWPGADGSEQTFDDFTGFYSVDDDMFYYSACTFNGVVIDLNNENMMTGTVVFAFQNGTYPADGGVQSAFTATITWNGGKTTTISGVADAEGYLVSKSGAWSFGEEGDEQRTVVTKSGINGWLTNEDGDEFRIYAARNRYAQATSGAAKSVVLTGLQATKGTWHVVLATDVADGEGEEFARGYTTLSITIANMGQVTVTGTLGDGTSVSTTSTLIIGDGCCCVPVSIRPYGGKGGFSFMLWFAWRADGSFGEDEASIQALTGWDASMSSHPFTATFEHDDLPLTFIDDQLYSGEADFKADEELLTTITMEGKTWKVAASDSKLKLSYNHQTGIFTGSFVVESEDAKSTATVSGVFTDRLETDDEGTLVSETYTGYGTAVIKGVGSVPVTIETTSAE